MKLFILAFTFVSTAFAADPCTAPKSVEKMAELLSQTFDGSKVACKDGTSFSTEFNFKCKGAEYVSTKEEPAVVAGGKAVYVATVLSEKSGNVVMTEKTYNSEAEYEAGQKPATVLPTRFLSMSDKSFSFYSDKQPEEKSWILSTWFIAKDETKARGYKIYADRAVECAAE